jgi:hypothetical protein
MPRLNRCLAIQSPMPRLNRCLAIRSPMPRLNRCLAIRSPMPRLNRCLAIQSPMPRLNRCLAIRSPMPLWCFSTVSVFTVLFQMFQHECFTTAFKLKELRRTNVLLTKFLYFLTAFWNRETNVTVVNTFLTKGTPEYSFFVSFRLFIFNFIHCLFLMVLYNTGIIDRLWVNAFILANDFKPKSKHLTKQNSILLVGSSFVVSWCPLIFTDFRPNTIEFGHLV